MSVITERNHIFNGVKQSDVKFTRLCMYNDIVDDNRFNLSIKFEPHSKYAQYHDHNGFCNITFLASHNSYTLVRRSQHPEWLGLAEMREFYRSETNIPETTEVMCGKGRFVGKKGKRMTPEPAYYTALVCSIAHCQNEYHPWAKIKIFDFEYELEMRKTHDDPYFSYIGQDENYYAEEKA